MGAQPSQLELWAGFECTVNRVQDRFFDQIERSGHDWRLEDLDRVAALGIRTLRYPILWERTSNAAVYEFQWQWSDERLARLRELRISPIAGLVHHGSGPEQTSLLDNSFSCGLERYAAAVARRYPWVRDYTPVNEPLTTARFSGLYGHWYPHAADPRLFAQAFLQECRATVLAMRAIRAVNSDARLVQTEDFGKTHSTEPLAYQAEFENHRRWLTWDILSGRIDRDHPMYWHLRYLGVAESDLEWFRDNPCPPEIIGVNHYLTSERFLDHRIQLYPQHTAGGNGRDRYADVEAVRVMAEGPDGLESLLREVCERYRKPVAITEIHNGCTREEQLRWLVDAWTAATRVRKNGGDVQAVTVWALLGAFDWNSLVTRETGHYEPGPFDLRSPKPRPTALSRIATQLAAGELPDHPLLDAPGWWRRPERLIFGVVCGSEAVSVQSINTNLQRSAARPVLVTGRTGTLGRAYARACDLRGIPYRLLGRDELDIADSESVEAALRRHDPWAVVNTAGYVRVDEAEMNRERCLRENADGPATLARFCVRGGVQLLTFSSDLVFDGLAGRPYVESDPVAPLSIYGQSKAEAERRVLQAFPRALVIRASAFFGPWDEHNFVTRTLRSLANGARVRAPANTVSPTYVPDLVSVSLDLLIDEEFGVWHLANVGAVTWATLARQVAAMAGYDSQIIKVEPGPRLGWVARRPRYSVLSSERAWLMPTLDTALDRYMCECTVDWRSTVLTAEVVV
jgi:dTDP-4-dehydrorhamnose reductase